MSQFRGARVHVQSGSATVRQVYKANIGTLGGTPPFQAGETVTWASGAGTGKYVQDNGSTIEFYRTSGNVPAVGNTITGSTSGATATIASFPTENLSVTTPVCAYPALFSSSTTQGAISSNDEFIINGEPVHKVSGTIGSDSFDLTLSWSGTTPLTNVECVIVRDRTANYGWPIPQQGSRLPWEVVKEALRQIDEDVNAGGGGGGGGGTPSAFVNLTLSSPWRNVPSRASLAYSTLPNTDSIQLQGLIDTGATPATVSTNSVIVPSGGTSAHLAPGRRPSVRQDFYSGGERFSIETDGSIVYRTPGQTNVVPGEISFCGVTFRADGS